MNPEDYIKLANLSKDLLIHRRKIEWRINFTLWAAMISLAVLLFQAGYNKSNLGGWYWVIVTTLGITAVSYIVFQLPTIKGSNKKDLNLILYFREKADPNIIPKDETAERWLKDIKLPAREYFWKQEKYYLTFVSEYITMILIFIAAIALMSLTSGKKSQPDTYYIFKGGPLKGTVGVLDVQASELFYNRLSVPEITPDGKVVKGELIQGSLSQSSANLPFYLLNTKKKEYFWFPKY